MQRKGGHRSATVGFAAAALLALPLVGAQAPLADAAKGGKKIRVCVAKKDPDKGTMRFAKKGKCKRGERKLAWNRKGKAGAQERRARLGRRARPGAWPGSTTSSIACRLWRARLPGSTRRSAR